LLTVSALLAGCQSDIEGMPVTSPDSPTEPSAPTSRPSRPTAAPPPATRTPRPPGTSRAPGGEQLEPENGYVFSETKSGKTRCQISTDEVGCESQFSNAPDVDGTPANGVRLTASGDLEWVVGNLGAIPARTLDYRTYHALGWTIVRWSFAARRRREPT
jgi:hypothetical protein